MKTRESMLEEFEALRPRMFGVAYRMTGSVNDAEDVCQEAWLRVQRVEPSDIENPEAFLVRAVTNLAIDRLRSAQRRRETYVGPYLPEPLVADTADDPADAAEMADSLTFAFLVLLDKLAPLERAVLLLHDVFGYSFDEVARAVDRTPAACRQIASRTRRRLEDERTDLHRPAASANYDAIERLVADTAAGNVEGIMAVLAPDVVFTSDGGPNRRAARHPVVGSDRVARFIANLGQRILEAGPTEVRFGMVNADPGLLIAIGGQTELVLAFAFAPDGRIRHIYSQLNPDKLKHVR
jgi:RNA polymerase sigma-70 factor (ECF subfamily)